MSETIPDRIVTSRGFVIYDHFFDTRDNHVRVQQSSAATRSCCWVFISTGGEAGDPAAAHLDLTGAKRLRDALDQFIRESVNGGLES